MTRSATRAASRTRGAAPPRWWPARLYYGWALVVALGVTATVSYGILSYGFAVFITPMAGELGWTKVQITGAFSIAQLVAGISAIPIGRWIDRHGSRGLMTVGSIAAALLLVAWSYVTSLVAFYLLWAAMGVAMAAVLYEPAFAVVATWFRQGRSRALTVLTFMGGFASVIFVPLATVLVAGHGWRSALLMLAAVYAALTIVPHALLLRRRPEDVGLVPDGIRFAEHRPAASGNESSSTNAADVTRSAAATRAVFRGAPFRLTAVAFTLSGFTTTAVGVHLVPLLLERGHGAAFAGGAMGVLGLMALPGRLVFTPLGGWLPRHRVTASIFALQAIALVVLLAWRDTMGIWLFVALFGAGFGAITPARAAVVADLVPATAFGRVSGVLAMLVSVARAAAPVGASVLYTFGGGLRGGYDMVTVILLLLSVGSGAAVWFAHDRAGSSIELAYAAGVSAAPAVTATAR